MIFYEKSAAQYSSYKKRMRIPLEGGESEGGYLQNFCLRDGYLGGGVGSEEVTDGSVQISALFCVGGAIAGYAPSGKLCVGSALADSGFAFTGIPDCVALPDGDGMLLSDGQTCVSVTSAVANKLTLPFRTAVFAYGRLWRTSDGVRLYYGALDDYKEAAVGRGKTGYIDSPDAKGKILRLFFVKNEILVLREYGLQKLVAHGDEEEFAFEDILSCAAVNGGSAAATQNALFWLTAEGFRVWGDAKVNGYSQFFAPHVSSDSVRGAACGDRYFLQSQYTLPDGTVAEGLGVFDAQGGGYLIPQKAEGLVSVQNGVFFTHGGKGYTVTEKGNFLGGIAHRVWQSAPTQPFGCRALLMEVCVRSKGPFLLQIKSDEGSRALCFAGGLCRKRVLLAGTVFSFRVQAEECELYALSAVFQRGEDKV